MTYPVNMINRIQEAKETYSKKLDLSNQGLSSLPDELSMLTKLDELKLNLITMNLKNSQNVLQNFLSCESYPLTITCYQTCLQALQQ